MAFRAQPWVGLAVLLLVGPPVLLTGCERHDRRADAPPMAMAEAPARALFEPMSRSAGVGMGPTYGQEGPFAVWSGQHDSDPRRMHEPHDELFDIETTPPGETERRPVTGARVTGTYWPANEDWPPSR